MRSLREIRRVDQEFLDALKSGARVMGVGKGATQRDTTQEWVEKLINAVAATGRVIETSEHTGT
jgi:hypothetical protein